MLAQCERLCSEREGTLAKLETPCERHRMFLEKFLLQPRTLMNTVLHSILRTIDTTSGIIASTPTLNRCKQLTRHQAPVDPQPSLSTTYLSPALIAHQVISIDNAAFEDSPTVHSTRHWPAAQRSFRRRTNITVQASRRSLRREERFWCRI